jgi:hypothetical protein
LIEFAPPRQLRRSVALCAFESLEDITMKSFGFSLCLLLVATASSAAQNTTQNFSLPELHTIKTVTLSPPYSCRSSEQFQKGYENTALFLSAYSKQRNVPDLLFNGACKSDNYFQPGTTFSLIADLGSEVSLAEVSASRAFNLRRVHSFSDYSKFVQAANVELNHTYAVLLNEDDMRGLFVFKVVEYVPDEKVVLQYAVKSYQVMPTRGLTSAGFDWEKRSN